MTFPQSLVQLTVGGFPLPNHATRVLMLLGTGSQLQIKHYHDDLLVGDRSPEYESTEANHGSICNAKCIWTGNRVRGLRPNPQINRTDKANGVTNGVPRAQDLYPRTTSIISTNASLVQTLPPTPQTHLIPLPSSNIITASVHQLAADFYPFDILAALTNAQWVTLQYIQLISPIHVHTPTGHIGTFYRSFAGQRITALEVFLSLRSMAASPLDLHAIFSGLPLDMKTRVRAAFYRRSTIPPSTRDTTWRRFICGQHVTDGPLGIDLLFGSSKVWGFEHFSLGGYSVIHLADFNSISA
ncbi:hypothetical protein P691DRAFT_790475 [Macrolepiota fuliginosa MF-IS2]|uniref:Uncharacterized protein n=1 Tax=Macrolepiota fuliginosa MF-IS2 TaxID=1400762 RepID=A0A9P5XG95_9AGAR|nr:hypothetical protein P691DRAFT_790475 [Macrolepiota fuliginosa MF-IS2]